MLLFRLLSGSCLSALKTKSQALLYSLATLRGFISPPSPMPTLLFAIFHLSVFAVAGPSSLLLPG